MAARQAPPSAPTSTRSARSPPAPPLVPEPATWAMMIAGFGLIGGALRHGKPLPA
nr:PEPxxWA-CTERM sorting domain-containing protein [Sphingomonas fennica]